jgi:hypothetical protein
LRQRFFKTVPQHLAEQRGHWQAQGDGRQPVTGNQCSRKLNSASRTMPIQYYGVVSMPWSRHANFSAVKSRGWTHLFGQATNTQPTQYCPANRTNVSKDVSKMQTATPLLREGVAIRSLGALRIENDQ